MFRFAEAESSIACEPSNRTRTLRFAEFGAGNRKNETWSETAERLTLCEFLPTLNLVEILIQSAFHADSVHRPAYQMGRIGGNGSRFT